MRKRFEGRLELMELEPRIAPSAIFGPLAEGVTAFDGFTPPDASFDLALDADFDFDGAGEMTLDDLAVSDFMSDPVGIAWTDGDIDQAGSADSAIEWTEAFVIDGEEEILMAVEEEAVLPEMTPAEAQVEIAAAPEVVIPQAPAPENEPRSQ